MKSNLMPCSLFFLVRKALGRRGRKGLYGLNFVSGGLLMTKL